MAETDLSNIIKNIGISLLLGFFSGYTLKQIGKFIIIFLGITFISIQIAQQNGWTKNSYPNSVLFEYFNLAINFKDEVIDELKIISTYLATKIPYNEGFASGFILGLWFG